MCSVRVCSLNYHKRQKGAQAHGLTRLRFGFKLYGAGESRSSNVGCAQFVVDVQPLQFAMSSLDGRTETDRDTDTAGYNIGEIYPRVA